MSIIIRWLIGLVFIAIYALIPYFENVHKWAFSVRYKQVDYIIVGIVVISAFRGAVNFTLKKFPIVEFIRAKFLPNANKQPAQQSQETKTKTNE